MVQKAPEACVARRMSIVAAWGQAFLVREQAHIVRHFLQAGPGEFQNAGARRKSLADSPLAKRAVPPVGSTWEGPAT